MILDTEFIVAVREADEPALEKAAELEAAGLPLRVPALVLYELHVGVGAGDDPIRNQREYEQLLANKPVVPVDENVAKRAGILQGRHLLDDGKPELGAADATVAASGLQFNEPVVTNDGDFEDVDGLSTERY